MINKVVISTDCVCDLPQKLVDRYSIPLMYYYVQLGEARFQDINEINSDSVLEYLSKGEKEVNTTCASVEEYRAFFKKISENDRKTVIHITIADHVSMGYQYATEAAESFANVQVIDSGKISGAMGLFVLVAADLAQKGATKDIILQRLRGLGEQINCSFTMSSAQCREYNKKLNKVLIGVMEILSIHPIITLKNSGFSLAGLCFGSKERRAVRYINRRLRNKDKISDEVLFLVFAGCDYEVRMRIEEEARKLVDWKNVYVLRASATISCNSGAGTFGMAFLNK